MGDIKILDCCLTRGPKIQWKGQGMSDNVFLMNRRALYNSTIACLNPWSRCPPAFPRIQVERLGNYDPLRHGILPLRWELFHGDHFWGRFCQESGRTYNSKCSETWACRKLLSQGSTISSNSVLLLIAAGTSLLEFAETLVLVIIVGSDDSDILIWLISNAKKGIETLNREHGHHTVKIS